MRNEDLVLAIQSGAGNKQDLLYTLFCQNAGMIERIIRRCQGAEDPADLRQESFFGLARAAELWDPNKEASFITYAVFWIKQAIYRYLENCGGVLRVPSYRRQTIREYYRTVRAFRNRFERSPTEKEMCAALGMTPEEVRTIFGRRNCMVIGSEELSKAVRDELKTINERSATVILEHFLNGKTLEECGNLLGVSAERARQLKEKGLRELRRPQHTRRLSPFFTHQGAYSYGLKGTGLSSFLLNGSSQEQAIEYLEHQTGVALYRGRPC